MLVSSYLARGLRKLGYKESPKNVSPPCNISKIRCGYVYNGHPLSVAQDIGVKKYHGNTVIREIP